MKKITSLLLVFAILLSLLPSVLLFASADDERFVLTEKLKDGDEIVIYNPGHGMAIKNETDNNWTLVPQAITPDGGVITNPDAVLVWTVVDNKDGTFSFVSGDSNAIAAWVNNSYIELTNDKAYSGADIKWKISWTDGLAYIRSATINKNLIPAYIECYLNAKSGKTSFSGYTTSNPSSSSNKKDYGMQIFVKGACEHNWAWNKVVGKDNYHTLECTECHETKQEACTFESNFCTVCGARTDIPEGRSIYEKVTTEQSDWSGTYVFAYEASADSAYLYNGSTADADRNYIETDVFDGSLLSPEDCAIVIRKSGDGYTFKAKNGYLDGKQYNGELSNGTTFNAEERVGSIKWENNAATVTSAAGSIMCFNKGSVYGGEGNYAWFRFFETSNYSKIPVTLYKLADSPVCCHSFAWDGETGKDGCHTLNCTVCGEAPFPEVCTYVNGFCTVCGARTDIPEGRSIYEKVTSAPDDWSGTYVIVYEAAADTAYLYNGSKPDENANYVETEIINGELLAPEDCAVIIRKCGSGYSFKAKKGYMDGKLYGGEPSNGTTFSTEASAVSISWDENTALLTSSIGTKMYFNTGSAYGGEGNYTWFRFFTAGGSDKKSVTLYKLKESACCHSFAWDGETGKNGYHTLQCSLCQEATFPEACTYVNGTCTVCGASEAVDVLKINSAYLKLNEDIHVIYTADIPSGYENPKMVFTFRGEEYTVAEYTVNDKGEYCFDFDKVTPQYMGENISATLYADVDDEQFSDTIGEYSVKKYCENQADGADQKLLTLLADTLVYGAAAQTFTGNTEGGLVTDGMTLTPSTFPGFSGKAPAFGGAADAAADWTAATLVLNSGFTMRLTFYAEDVTGLTVQCSVNGRKQIFDKDDFVSKGNHRWYVDFSDVKATEFDNLVVASFYRDGKRIGRLLGYSYNTYICAMQDSGDAALREMVRALYNYGASAAAYAGK